MIVERTYQLPGGGQVSVRVESPGLVNETEFPILKRANMIDTATRLIAIADGVKA